ncbi:MAG: single-stranded DNA-binding protein [Corynebacterium sp.]|uniref:single-stranded DNA-binding protein n=1 Tax=Corynebacterium sp. TaxID=1720 RepID=UPI003F0E51CD
MATISITGTLGKDPEGKTSNAGKPFARFSLAWSESSKDQQGNWQDGPTQWVQVTCFGRVAQNLVTSLHKGDRVNVTGRIKPESWSSQQGEQTVLALTADSVSPDLTFASVQVQKNPKGGQGGSQDGFGGQQGGGDPWNSAPSSNGFDDGTPPPF